MPASKLARFGVWEHGRFIGAVIFGMGANNHLVSPYCLKPHEGCELVRVALDKHTAPVTRIVAVAIKRLKRKYPAIRLIVSYADPGEGHRGGIYQAGNWTYDGTTPSDKFPVIDGKVTHPRTLSSAIATGRIKDRKSVPYVKKPGKHRYLYPLDKKMRVQIQALAQPYPKAESPPEGDLETD